jgi:hypothetical protein
MMLKSEVGVEMEAVASPDQSSSIITEAKKINNRQFAFRPWSTIHKLNLRRLVHNYCVYLSAMQTVTENKKLLKM